MADFIAFLSPQVEPQYLFLGFINHAAGGKCKIRVEISYMCIQSVEQGASHQELLGWLGWCMREE